MIGDGSRGVGMRGKDVNGGRKEKGSGGSGRGGKERDRDGKRERKGGVER